MYKIPRLPSWCSYCIVPERYGNPPGTRCSHHASSEYSGVDAYDPSAFVLETVGKRFNSPLDGVAECFGYDPRHGFWMRFATGAQRNVSERAIGRTYHRIWTEMEIRPT